MPGGTPRGSNPSSPTKGNARSPRSTRTRTSSARVEIKEEVVVESFVEVDSSNEAEIDVIASEGPSSPKKRGRKSNKSFSQDVESDTSSPQNKRQKAEQLIEEASSPTCSRTRGSPRGNQDARIVGRSTPRSRKDTESSVVSSVYRPDESNAASDIVSVADEDVTMQESTSERVPQKEGDNESEPTQSTETKTPVNTKRRRGRPAGSTKKVKEEEVEQEDPRSATPSEASVPPQSPRASRKRQPSRKLLESKLDENFVLEKPAAQHPPTGSGRRGRPPRKQPRTSSYSISDGHDTDTAIEGQPVEEAVSANSTPRPVAQPKSGKRGRPRKPKEPQQMPTITFELDDTDSKKNVPQISPVDHFVPDGGTVEHIVVDDGPTTSMENVPEVAAEEQVVAETVELDGTVTMDHADTVTVVHESTVTMEQEVTVEPEQVVTVEPEQNSRRSSVSSVRSRGRGRRPFPTKSRTSSVNEPVADFTGPSTSTADAGSGGRAEQVADSVPPTTTPGDDLPDEHRPRDRARPVMLQTAPRIRPTEIQQPQRRGRAYFSKEVANESLPPEETIETTEGGEVVEDGIIMQKDAGYTMIDENGREIVYEMGVNEFVEEVEYSEIPEGMEVIEEREVQNEDGTTSIIQSVAPRSSLPPRIDHGIDTVVVKQETTTNEQEEEDDDAPPRLVPELGPTGPESARRNPAPQEMYVDGENLIRVQSPGGTQQYVHVARGEDGSEIYVDANGDEVQMVEEVAPAQEDLRTVEFNFLDSKNICCGLCGEIVPYDNLMTVHLPNMHPEVLGDGGMNLEEIPYETWLRDKLYVEKKNMESGFRAFESNLTTDDSMRARSQRPLRKVSQIRVNPVEMTLPQLELALKKKMIEKMGRKVPVSLVDKQHARCGICNSVVSLNKKFEIIHLVRHFNAWHPSAHRCAGTWQNRPVQIGSGKPLSIQDFAVIDVSMEAPDNLQCIWCGMFMDRNALAMHFTEVHPDEIEVPKCLLCLQELVINARLLEKYGEDFEVVLPDEFHVKCHKFEQTYSSEVVLDRAIARRVQKMQVAGAENQTHLEDDDDLEDESARDTTYTNSRMQFGRRNKPKRSFVQPSFRQAIPANSLYVEAISQCQWKCKLCGGNIFGAVISAGAIKHYKLHHPGEMENMQYELCKARLERVSDGCMEFVHPQLVECLLCNLTYALHKPYNMCRGIRHLKAKHPEMMPEYTGGTGNGDQSGRNGGAGGRSQMQMGETIDDPEMIARFKNEYNVDFEKVQTLYGADGEPVYVLLGAGEELDPETARQLASSLDEGGDRTERRNERATSVDDEFDEEDPFGELREEEELAAMETKDYGSRVQRGETQRSQTDRRMMPHHEAVTRENFKQRPVVMREPSDQRTMQTPDHTEEVYNEEIVGDYQEIYEDEHGQVFLDGEHPMDAEYLDDQPMQFIETGAYEEHANQ